MGWKEEEFTIAELGAIFRLEVEARWAEKVYGARFWLEVCTDAIHSHACSLEANMRVTNSGHTAAISDIHFLTVWYCKFRSNTKGVPSTHRIKTRTVHPLR